MSWRGRTCFETRLRIRCHPSSTSIRAPTIPGTPLVTATATLAGQIATATLAGQIIRVSLQLPKGVTDPGVASLVIELVQALVALVVGALVRNPVVLRDAHATAQHVARLRVRLHAEGATLDDVDTAVGGDVWARSEALHAVHALGDIARLLRGHGELE
eukprot:1321519-Rhodomonas_salina.1